MFKVAAKFFKKLKDALPNMVNMAQNSLHISVIRKRRREAKRDCLQHYVRARGTVIAEFDESNARTSGERSGLQDAKDLCTSTGAILIIAKLDRAGRGSVLLFTPPADAAAQLLKTRRTPRAFHRPQLATAN